MGTNNSNNYPESNNKTTQNSMNSQKRYATDVFDAKAVNVITKEKTSGTARIIMLLATFAAFVCFMLFPLLKITIVTKDVNLYTTDIMRIADLGSDMVYFKEGDITGKIEETMDEYLKDADGFKTRILYEGLKTPAIKLGEKVESVIIEPLNTIKYISDKAGTFYTITLIGFGISVILAVAGMRKTYFAANIAIIAFLLFSAFTTVSYIGTETSAIGYGIWITVGAFGLGLGSIFKK